MPYLAAFCSISVIVEAAGLRFTPEERPAAGGMRDTISRWRSAFSCWAANTALVPDIPLRARGGVHEGASSAATIIRERTLTFLARGTLELELCGTLPFGGGVDVDAGTSVWHVDM